MHMQFFCHLANRLTRVSFRQFHFVYVGSNPASDQYFCMLVKIDESRKGLTFWDYLAMSTVCLVLVF